MTRDEYLKLVKASEAFAAMDAELQQKILDATGEEMKKYAAIFTEENDLIVAAKKELVQKNEEVLKNIGVDMKKLSREYLKNTETLIQKKDLQGAEDLLETI